MTYRRVLPRDLFNEANLLKCYAQLWIALENTRPCLGRFGEDDVSDFNIAQDPSDGSIRVANLTFLLAGRPRRLFRPLNSREPWPLWLRLDEDDVRVFDDDGKLSPEMLKVLQCR
jgi:hypothetical protein